jgi:hypothetical protein
MAFPRMSSVVQRITVVRGGEAATIYESRAKRKKKGGSLLRPFERAVRQIASGAAEATGEYKRRHDKANRKSKDGWLRYIGLNSTKAATKGYKKLNVMRVVTYR